MALPNLNPGSTRPAEVAPGQDPNAKQRSQPGVFSQFVDNASATLRENANPSNFIRTGTYNAFGNNVLTRTGLGLMDAATDLLGSPFRGPGEQDSGDVPTKMSRTLERHTNILMQMNDTLTAILDGQTKFFESFGKDKQGKGYDDLHDLNGKPNFTMPSEEQNRIEPKNVLSTLTQENTIPVKILIESKDILGSILASVNKIKTIMIDMTPLSTAENDAESRRKGIKNVDVEDAKIVSENGIKPMIGGDKTSWWGAITLALTSLADMIVENFDSIKKFIGEAWDKMKTKITAIWGATMDKAKDAGKAAWDFVKEGAKKAGKFGGEIIDDVVKKTEPAIKFAKDLGSKGINAIKEANIPGKLAGVAEKVSGKSIGKALGKQALKTGAKVAAGMANPLVGIGVTAGLVGYDAQKGYSEAGDILDIKGRKTTFGEKMTAAGGGAIESLSFGLLDRKDAAKWIERLTTSEEDKVIEMQRQQEQLKIQGINDNVASKSGDQVTIGSVNNKVENNYAMRRETRNQEASYNRYMDKHYSFS